MFVYLQTHKGVVTSPVQDVRRPSQGGIQSPVPPVIFAASSGKYSCSRSPPSGGVGMGPTPQKGSSSSHVRFQTDYRVTPSSLEKPLQIPQIRQPRDGDSSESETENTTNDEEGQLCEKFLLLIDQPSVDVKRHLSIKDIGVILDRLSSKIVDVERLDRESEEDNCHNWTIKAMIRGDSLRELGVLYGGHYYTICEHPAYTAAQQQEEDEHKEDAEEEEEEPV